MRLTFKTKLIASFAAVLAMTASVGWYGIDGLVTVNQSLTGFAARPYVQVVSANAMQTAIETVRRSMLLALTTSDAAVLRDLDAEYAAAWTGLEEALDKAIGSMNPEGRALFAELPAAVAAAKTRADAAYAMARAVDPDTASRYLLDSGRGSQALREALDRLEADLASAGALSQPLRSRLTGLDRSAADARILMARALADADEADIAEESEALNAIDRTIRADLGALAGALPPALAGEARALLDVWGEQFAVLRAGGDVGVANELDKALDAAAAIRPALVALGDEMDAMAERADETATTFLTDAQSTYEASRGLLMALVAGAVALGAAAAAWISMAIARGFRRSIAAARTIAAGDLSRAVPVRGRDEVADLLGAMEGMRVQLRAIVGDVLGSAGQVASGSRESSTTAEQLAQSATEQSSSTQELSQGVTEQAAATEQASAAMEEMAANIRQNADNAAQTEKIAAQANHNAEKSGQAVANSVEAMRTIAEKIRIVQEIARQTDLLALNAAIEAARAGSHGKGFAVVASEVRKLAERSQLAASEIGELSASTLHVSEEAGRMLQALVPDIRKTAELVGEISAACREQTIGAEQINQAIQQLDQVTQQTHQAIQLLDQTTHSNAGAANEMSATAEALSGEADVLADRIAFFKLEGGADQTAGAVAAARLSAVAERGASKAHPASGPAKADVRSLQAKAQGFASSPRAGAAKPRAQKGGLSLNLDDDTGFERMSG